VDQLGIGIFQLAMCAALGIVLGVVGGHVEVKYKGIVVAGAGALTILLFLIVNGEASCRVATIFGLTKGSCMPAPPEPERSLTGELRGNFTSEMRGVAIQAPSGKRALGYVDYSGDKPEFYEFEIKKDYLSGRCFKISILEKNQVILWVAVE